MSSPDPSKLELSLITKAGRLRRMIAAGMTLEEATAKMLTDETAEEYAERNRAAMEALEARILSPAYMQRFEAIRAEPDPVKRAALEADLKRDNFAEIDMEAVHRNISARNRQMQQEGLLPPDVKL